MDDIEQILIDLRRFVAERDWHQFHDPKNLAMLLGSEVGELMAEYRWVSSGDADVHSRDVEARKRIAAEIGDVGIALLMLCDRIGVDLLHAVKEKLGANGKRYPVETAKGKAGRPGV